MIGGQLLQLPAGLSGAHQRGQTGQPGQMSIASMQAAVIAIRAGVFDAVPDGERAAAAVPPPARSQSNHDAAVELGGPAVVVLAAHPGAGASTVALAVAEALAGRWRVQLVEYADPRRSGLGAASSRELGVDAGGWRRGRRGAVNLARLTETRPSIEDFPLPPNADDTPDGDRLLVVDAGWPVAPTLPGSGWLPTLLGTAQLVVVTRVTVPGVRQTEHLLTALGVPAVVATVGSGRWPGVVAASCGPALRAARTAGRTVMVPTVRRLEIAGLTADPLPKPVAVAGKALAALLSPDQPVLTGLSVTSPVAPLKEGS